MPVTRIWLAPGDGRVAGLGGGTELHLPQDWELASPILAAGEVAAQRWLLHTGRWSDAAAWAVEMSAADDRRRLADAAERADLPYVEYRGDWDRACTEARRLLACQWFAVEAIALQLLHEPDGAIDERAIDELADVFVIR
ncbi:hypothetical protein AB0442_40805 [Kitasatospora sp. NPDC085895]|uniref:hypothetical protein n=1 Tax=Kitasatospora sp. NPDC085895 TaxID=3155057 RepID=UPI003450BF19